VGEKGAGEANGLTTAPAAQPRPGCSRIPKRSLSASNSLATLDRHEGDFPFPGRTTALEHDIGRTARTRSDTARRHAWRVTVLMRSIDLSNDSTAPTPVASACATRYASAKSRRSTS
jgi:hypothetical protein